MPENTNESLNDLLAGVRDAQIRNARPLPQNRDRLWGDFIVAQDQGAEIFTTIKTSLKQKDDSSVTVLDQFGPRIHPGVAKAMAAHKDQIIYGIELEIEKWPVPARELDAVGFTFTEDGSLRNNGYEAVSIPNSKVGILNTTAALWKKYGITERNFSDRTSIHVHANVLNFTLDNVRSLCIVYATIEDLVFSFVGEERRKNIFCVPWTEAGLRVGTINNIFEYARQWQKYTALNLLTMRTQGTVEWRHMEGHCDITRLENWITIIDEVMNYSRNVNPDELRKIIGGLNTTSEYGAWISSVLPKSHTLFTHDQIVKNLTRGVIETKLLLLSK